MDSEILEERMERLLKRHSVGPDKPSYFLLHRDDAQYMVDRHLPEMSERYREEGLGICWLRFMDIPVAESDLASKGRPLVVCQE
jgi:hypothetical protein